MNGQEFLINTDSTFGEWKEVLYREWRQKLRGDDETIPRYSIARMLGADGEDAKKCIE